MSDPHEAEPVSATKAEEIAGTRLILDMMGSEGATVVIDGGCEGDVTFSGVEYLAMTAGIPLPNPVEEPPTN